MRVAYYFLTFLFGLYGVLAGLRFAEHVIVGDSLPITQAAIAAAALYLAFRFLQRARGLGAGKVGAEAPRT